MRFFKINTVEERNPDAFGKGGIYAAAIAVAIAVFLLKFTPHVLNPTHYDWLMSYADCPTEYVSWQFYRNSPWHLPVIGTLVGYDYPTVTGIGLTGAIPLLAIPFKILSPLLPIDFQYFGFWFLACYILQAVFSVRLLRGLSNLYDFKLSPIALILGATFFILSPALLTRTGHMNLCAQWLILWSFCIYFEPKTVKQKFFSFLKIIATTALIHQYLLLIVFGLAFATYWKAEKTGRFSWVLKGLMNLAGLALAMLIWYIVGNFNTSTTTMAQIGFGKFSANLNTFFNGQGEQFLMPTLPVNTGQYEGQGYLGGGVLLMGLIVLIAYVLTLKNRKKLKIHFSPLGFVAVLFALFAFSHLFTFGNKTIFEANFMLENTYFNFLSQAFRSSGRFIWVSHYLLIVLFIIGFLTLKLRKTWIISSLSIFLLVQLVDVAPMITREQKYYDFDGYEPSVMTSKTWQHITREAERVVMLPPFTLHYKTYEDYIHFARISALNRQSITTGYLARPDWQAHELYEKKTFASLDKGELGDEQNSIFIATQHSIRKLKKIVESGQVKAFMYEDYIIGVPLKFEKTIKYLSELPHCTIPNMNTEGLAEFLAANDKETILAVVRDDAAWKLCPEAKTQLQKMGCDISKLTLRSGLAGVIHKGKFVFQKITPDSVAIIQKFNKGDNINGFVPKNSFELHSAGGTAGNFGKIIFNKIDHSMSQRGFNFVVVDSDFKVLKTAYFDTFDDCYSGEVNGY